MTESTAQFEARKQDHLRISLSPKVQASGQSGLDQVQLIHEALPEIDFSEVTLASDLFGMPVASPLFISSMTAGHAEGTSLNIRLAQAAAERGWPLGVGSQRRELTEPSAREEWRELRRRAPKAILLGNLGLAQVIRSPVEDVQRLIDHLEARAFFIHCNALQECLQEEGNPQFKGGLQAIEKMAKGLAVPVIVKETGCGFSKETLRRLRETGVAAVDVAGLGGTHWGRVEGERKAEGHLLHEAAWSFKDWGISTVQSLCWAGELSMPCEIWASGGVRNGLDAGKLLALGATHVGIAQPLLKAAVQGDDELARTMERFEFELKVALFCTGARQVSDWQKKKVWRWNSIEKSEENK